MTKLCSSCKKEKSFEFFGKLKSKKDGLRDQCKECRNEATRSEYKKDKSRFRERSKRYTEKTNYNYNYYRKNLERNRENNRQYYYKNKERVVRYMLERYKTDIDYKLRLNLRRRMGKLLRGWKSGSAVRDLGCTVPELRKHLESKFKEGMSWDNYGKGWHIDHIVPLVSFNLKDREQFLKACHYTNLQPLWAQENLIKSGKIPTQDKIALNQANSG